MIVALAGRRIDAPGARSPRFPLENIELVSRAIHDLFLANKVRVLVSSAASGADLLGLQEAGHLGLRRRVVLPFDRKRFRETSVTDRPGNWGWLYDQVLDEVTSRGDLITLFPASEDLEAYTAINRVILDEAQAIADKLHQDPAAVLVWDYQSRGGADFTQAFGDEARKRGLSILQVRTIGTSG